MSISKKVKAADFDSLFEHGDNITEHLDLTSVKAHYPTQRITIDSPKIILDELDIEAAKIGVRRTSLIKIWVAEHLHKKKCDLNLFYIENSHHRQVTQCEIVCCMPREVPPFCG